MKRSLMSSIDCGISGMKKEIMSLCINDGDYSIADLSKELGASIPTVTKLIGELIDDGILEDLGKQNTNGGRRPSIYGLNPSAGYFVGIETRKEHISIAITNFKGQTIYYCEDIPFVMESSESSFRGLCNVTREHISKAGLETGQVFAYGVNLSGRVNNITGYCFTYFLGEERSVKELLEEELNAPVFVENDSRAMAYGEYLCGAVNGEKDVLFLNIAWGLGMGMILDGKLSYGKSGFSGEIGHFPLLNNDQICRCGKVGCLETGASGYALHRILTDKMKEGRSSMLSSKMNDGERIILKDILDAIHEEDVLAIESVAEVGTTLGRAIAGLINLFNPELIIIGGRIAEAGDYLLYPIKSAIQKHSLNLINRDTKIKFSKLGRKAGSVGACMLSRSKFLGLM